MTIVTISSPVIHQALNKSGRDRLDSRDNTENVRRN